jgi:KDO2-lipid IV(A) lauroyltransferase
MWVGIGALYLCAWLPFRLRMVAGALLGLATYIGGRERRYITAVNIALCFPELSEAEQQALVRRSFIDNGIGMIETATGWWRPARHFQGQLTMLGTEHLDAALAAGRGVLLLGGHYSTLDFGANLLGVRYPFGVTYRAHKNPLFDAFMLRGRISNCNGVFDRKDIRGMYRHLQQNRILWYAPDQDYGPDQAVYVPYFGHPAATLTAASRFASFNHSPVVLVRQHRDTRNKRYTLEFTSLSPPLPSSDEVFDATTINAAVERAVRQEPSQYLWMHKRFKTQRGGKPDSPYIHIKTPDKKLNETQYAGMLEGATQDPGTGLKRLASGLVLREFPSLPSKFRKHRHPAFRLDHLSKSLRSSGLRTLTTDNIFRVKVRKLTAVTCFMPAGLPLAKPTPALADAATFLAQLHNHGFHFTGLQIDMLAASDKGLVLVDPLQVRQVPGSASYQQRLDDLRAWARASGEVSALASLLEHYYPLVRRADAAGFHAWVARLPTLAGSAV